MRTLVVCLVIFFATLLLAALVALGHPRSTAAWLADPGIVTAPAGFLPAVPGQG